MNGATFRSRWLLPFASVLAVLQLQCTCGPGTALHIDPPEPVDVARQSAPAPIVAVSVNGSALVSVAPGWPWVIEAAVIHPAALGHGATPAFEIVGPAGDAESALALELLNAQGQKLAVNFERIGGPLAAPFTLTEGSRLSARWRLSPAESAMLAPGSYQLVLRLQASTFSVTGMPAQIDVSATPDAGMFGAELSRVDDALARAAWSEAEAEADTLLAVAPENVRALTRKGIAREAVGDPVGAFAAYDRALREAERRTPGAPEGGALHLKRLREGVREAADGGAY